MLKSYFSKFKKIAIGCLSAFSVLAVVISPLVAVADNSNSGLDIITDTRYSQLSLGSFIDDYEDYLNYMYDNTQAPPEVFTPEWYNNILKRSADMLYPFIQSNVQAVQNADNWENGALTFKDSFSFIAKRRLIYPYDDLAETDYLICYVDKNNPYTPQQFGSYTITPNSLLLVRDTNWNGVEVYSIPLELNGFEARISYYGCPFAIVTAGNDSDTFIYESQDNTMTVGQRHLGSNSYLSIVNNDYNTIVCNNLVDKYVDNQSFYHVYLSDGDVLSPMECLFGTGYDYVQSQGFMQGFPDWYLTTGYINIPDYQYYNDLIYKTNNNIYTETPDPKNAPVYIVPDDYPFHSGQTINQNTVNNYNDYGVTYNNSTNEFDVDIPVLAGAIGAEVTPILTGLFNGTFALQPSIGADFSLSPSLDYNYIDIVDDFINKLIINGGGSWEPPSYPAVNTQPIITAQIPTYNLSTIPPAMGQVISQSLGNGWDMFDSLGILSILVPCVLIIVFWRFTGK